MNEIQKDRKNFAAWSFVIGSVSMLLYIGSYFISSSTAISSFIIFYLLLIAGSMVGLILGITSINSSVRAAAIGGIILCIIDLMFLLLAILGALASMAGGFWSGMG